MCCYDHDHTRNMEQLHLSKDLAAAHFHRFSIYIPGVHTDSENRLEIVPWRSGDDQEVALTVCPSCSGKRILHLASALIQLWLKTLIQACYLGPGSRSKYWEQHRPALFSVNTHIRTPYIAHTYQCTLNSCITPSTYTHHMCNHATNKLNQHRF